MEGSQEERLVMKLSDLRDGTCENCGEAYEQKRYDQRFCCRSCKASFETRERSAVEREIRRQARSGYVCPECSITFNAPTLASQIYCSIRCKRREMMRRYRKRLGEDEFVKRQRAFSRRAKGKIRAQRTLLTSVIRRIEQIEEMMRAA